MAVKSIWKRVAVAGTGMALAMGLAACSAQPGTALVVDGKEYSEAEVSQAAQELSMGAGQNITVQTIVALIQVEPALVEMADKNNIEFTDADARKALASVEEANGEPVSDATVAATRGIQLQGLLSSVVQDPAVIQTQLVEALQTYDSEVNPRFGIVGPENLMQIKPLAGVFDPTRQ